MKILSTHPKAYIIKAHSYSSEEEKKDLCERVKDFLMRGQCFFEPEFQNSGGEEDLLYSFKEYSKYLFNIKPENILANTSVRLLSDLTEVPHNVENLEKWDLSFRGDNYDDYVYFSIAIRDSLIIKKIIYFGCVRFSVDYSLIENNPPEGDSIKENFLKRELESWQNYFSYQTNNLSHRNSVDIDFVEGKVILPDSLHYPRLEFYLDKKIDSKERALFASNKPSWFTMVSWKEEDYTFLDARKYLYKFWGSKSRIVEEDEKASIPDRYLSTGTKIIVEVRYKPEYVIVGR